MAWPFSCLKLNEGEFHDAFIKDTPNIKDRIDRLLSIRRSVLDQYRESSLLLLLIRISSDKTSKEISLNVKNIHILPHHLVPGTFSRVLRYLHNPDERFIILPIWWEQGDDQSTHPQIQKLREQVGWKRPVDLLFGFQPMGDSTVNIYRKGSLLRFDDLRGLPNLIRSTGHEFFLTKEGDRLQLRNSLNELLETYIIGADVSDQELIMAAFLSLFRDSLPMAEPTFVAERRFYDFPTVYIYSTVDKRYGTAEWFSLTTPDHEVPDVVAQVLKERTAEGSEEFRYLKELLEQDERFKEVHLLPDNDAPRGKIRPIFEARSAQRGVITVIEESAGRFTLEDTGVVFSNRPIERNLPFSNLLVYLKHSRQPSM